VQGRRAAAGQRLGVGGRLGGASSASLLQPLLACRPHAHRIAAVHMHSPWAGCCRHVQGSFAPACAAHDLHGERRTCGSTSVDPRTASPADGLGHARAAHQVDSAGTAAGADAWLYQAAPAGAGGAAAAPHAPAARAGWLPECPGGRAWRRRRWLRRRRMRAEVRARRECVTWSTWRGRAAGRRRCDKHAWGGQCAVQRWDVSRCQYLSGMGAGEYRYLQRLEAHLSRMGASWLSGTRVCRLCRAAGAAVRFVP